MPDASTRLVLFCMLGFFFNSCAQNNQIRKVERTVPGCEDLQEVVQKVWYYDSTKKIFMMKKKIDGLNFDNVFIFSGSHTHCLEELDTSAFFQLFGYPSSVNYEFQKLIYCASENCGDKDDPVRLWFEFRFNENWEFQEVTYKQRYIEIDRLHRLPDK